MLRRPSLSRIGGKATAVASSSLLAAGLAFTPSAADAAVPAFSGSEELALRTQMTTIGISPGVQNDLIAKIESGTLPDSARESMRPVASLSETVAGRDSTVGVFADGSRRVTTATSVDDANSIGTFSSKSGCKSSGGWYTNCKISISDIFSNASFVVDYQTSSSSKAKVRDVRSARCSNTVGGCSVSAAVKRATQSSAGAAWAELSFQADVGHIGSGVSGAFGIRVSGKSVSLYG